MTTTFTMDSILPLLADDGTTILLNDDGITELLMDGPADVSAAVLYGTVTLKFNTLDMALIDTGIPALGSAVMVTNPAWSGVVAATTTSDPTLQANGHQVVTVTATNANVLPNDTAPFDLSDSPVAFTDTYLLEDGSGPYLLESGTDFANGTTDAYLMEGALSYPYSGLTVRKVTGSPPTTLATCTVQQPGLRPGNTIHLTSANQGLAAVAYQINQATLQWHGVPLVPQYLIEMGDTPATLAAWTLANATSTAAATAPTAVPSGPVIFGQATTSNGLKAVGAGIVTVATATFSISVPAGHTLTCQVLGAIDAQAAAWDNYVAVPRRAVRATLSGGLYTGAWQELPIGGGNIGTRVVTDVSSAPGIAMAAGTYTVTIDIDSQEFNQIRVFGGWVQVAVTTV